MYKSDYRKDIVRRYVMLSERKSRSVSIYLAKQTKSSVRFLSRTVCACYTSVDIIYYTKPMQAVNSIVNSTS
jgi:hypothetical protein